MTRKGAFVAAAVVVFFNLATLAAVWVNRSGEPEAVLQLTERELSLPPREAENTALALQLEWVDTELLRPGPGWFDRRKLDEIGFDCSLPLTPENRAHYSSMPPRATYAVLEYEGEAWQRYLSEPRVAPPTPERFPVRHAEREPSLRIHRSHLVLVDAGNDPAALRARYTDRRRHVVLPATAVLVVQDENGSLSIEGRVTMILPSQVNVTRDQRRLLETLQTERRAGVTGLDRAAAEPRYRATVKWGSSFEPWLADVTPIAR